MLKKTDSGQNSEIFYMLLISQEDCPDCPVHPGGEEVSFQTRPDKFRQPDTTTTVFTPLLYIMYNLPRFGTIFLKIFYIILKFLRMIIRRSVPSCDFANRMNLQERVNRETHHLFQSPKQPLFSKQSFRY